MDTGLKGRAAIVTGGSGGIGGAVALALAAEGANVAVAYLSRQDAAMKIVEAIRALGVDALAIRADVRAPDQVKALVAQTGEAFKRLDILVNNAGELTEAPVALTSEKQWRKALDVNLTGAFFCLKAVSRVMARQKWGRIINISSVAGLTGAPHRAAYAAAKAGLLGLTRSAAGELAISGITVNAIAPGMVATAMTSDLPEARREKFLKNIPLGRFAKPEEVAALAVFLASEAAGYVTGQTLAIDGGLQVG